MKLDSILASKIFSFAFLCPFKVSRARNFERTAEIKDFKLEIKSVEIENVFGQSVYQSAISSLQSAIKIDVSNFSLGVYFLKLQTANAVAIKKFVKE